MATWWYDAIGGVAPGFGNKDKIIETNNKKPLQLNKPSRTVLERQNRDNRVITSAPHYGTRNLSSLETAEKIAAIQERQKTFHIYHDYDGPNLIMRIDVSGNANPVTYMVEGRAVSKREFREMFSTNLANFAIVEDESQKRIVRELMRILQLQTQQVNVLKKMIKEEEDTISTLVVRQTASKGTVSYAKEIAEKQKALDIIKAKYAQISQSLQSNFIEENPYEYGRDGKYVMVKPLTLEKIIKLLGDNYNPGVANAIAENGNILFSGLITLVNQRQKGVTPDLLDDLRIDVEGLVRQITEAVHGILKAPEYIEMASDKNIAVYNPATGDFEFVDSKVHIVDAPAGLRPTSSNVPLVEQVVKGAEKPQVPRVSFNDTFPDKITQAPVQVGPGEILPPVSDAPGAQPVIRTGVPPAADVPGFA